MLKLILYEVCKNSVFYLRTLILRLNLIEVADTLERNILLEHC